MAIVGAPTDDLVSDRPGTRFGPRAIRAASCPPGPHLEAKVDAFEELRVVRLRRRPGAARRRARDATRRSRRRSARCSTPGAIPIVLGGDHGIAEPDIRACAKRHGPVGLVHFDTHTDTGTEVFGVEVSHGTPMYRLVEQGHVDPEALRPDRPARLLARRGGVRLAGRAGASPALFMHDVRERGIEAVMDERARGGRATGPTFLSVDVDVLDPAFAPGHRHTRAGRHDLHRPAAGPAASSPPRLRARRRRGGRGDPDRGRLADVTASSPTGSCARS